MLTPIPELINLKYLMISMVWNTGYYFCEIINFIRACSLLETFALEVNEAYNYIISRNLGKVIKTNYVQCEGRWSH